MSNHQYRSEKYYRSHPSEAPYEYWDQRDHSNYYDNDYADFNSQWDNDSYWDAPGVNSPSSLYYSSYNPSIADSSYDISLLDLDDGPLDPMIEAMTSLKSSEEQSDDDDWLSSWPAASNHSSYDGASITPSPQ